MPGLCGTITYELLTDTYSPQSLVQFLDSPDNSLDNLYFAPTINDAVGVYPLIFRGILTYQGVVLDTAEVPVTAIINNCFAELNL